MSREFYLQEHDPERWGIESAMSPSPSTRAKTEV
jgi:hypothetical protein